MPVSTIVSGNNNLLNCVDSSSNNNFAKLRQGILFTNDLNLTIDSSVSLVSPTSIISSSSSLSSSSSPSSIVSSSSSNYPPSETTVYEESIKSSEGSTTTDEETVVESEEKVDEKPCLKELKTLEIEKLLINFAANRGNTTTAVSNSDINVSSTTNSNKGLEKEAKLTNEEIENESSLILKEIYANGNGSDDLESEDCDFDFDDETILNHFDEDNNSRINCIQELIVDDDDEEDEDDDDDEQKTNNTSCENSNSCEGNKNEEKYLSLENPNAALCKFCQDGKEHPCKENLIWSIKLPIDLIETLIQLCPNFFDDFEEVDMDPMDISGSEEVLIEDDDSTRDSTDVNIASSFSSSTTNNPPDDGCNQPEPSPPNVQVDDSPLQVNKNKESLKVKLLMRRPMNQLIEQGILPPPKTPPAFAGQRVRLERARMGDLLKAKIQQRPARQELIRQHILEDSNARVAPLLAEKQRMLKKARLADSLNDHLIHRPGPLELVQKNILHAPDVIEKAVKEGVVNFKATSEGSTPGPHVANMYIGSEDESSSSDMSSPAGTPDQPPQTTLASNDQSGKFVITSIGTTTSTAQIVPSSPTSITSSAPMTSFTPPPPPPMPTFIIHDSNISKLVQGSSSTTNIPITVSAAQLNRLIDFTGGNQAQLGNLIAGLANQQQQQQSNSNLNQIQPNQQSSTINKIRSSKKSSKTKSQNPKARQIKFHEYKGPPNSKAQSSLQASLQQPAESSYELLLQQQQLFLQWQLEWQHKYPQIILPAVSKITSPSEITGKLTSLVASSAAASPSLHKSGNNTINSIISGNTTAVLSPSTIISSTQPQPIAPAPMKIDTSQSPISIITPTIHQNNKSNSDIRSKIAVKIDSFSQAKSNNNLNKTFNSNNSSNNNNNSNNNNGTQGSNNNNNNNNNVSSSGSIHSLPNFSKLNDWKVSDLKAELKKHNLTVSGSKPQLIERLKTLANNITNNNDQRVQDESISTTSSSTIGNQNHSTFIKNEAPSSEEISSGGDGEMMDVGESDVNNEKSMINVENYNNNNNQQQPKLVNIFGKNLDGSKIIKTIMTNSSANKNDSNNQDQNSKTNNNGYNIIIDESLIREQQKQIEQLQQALKLSQHQLQQMKLTQQSGGQKHRLALQHHLQQKIQQQALQTQLQKLIQLHSIQQQQQKSNQVSNHKQQPTTPIMVQQSKSQISNDKEEKSDSDQRESILKSDNSTPIILTTRNSSNLNNLPFTIVKISSKSTIMQPKIEDEHKQGQQNNIIPQLQIPEDKVSFQIKVGENEKNITGQSSKTIPFVNSISSVNNTNSTDHQMDHSWLLKINEQPNDSPNYKNGISSNIFDGANVTRASLGQQQQQQHQTTQNTTNSNQVMNKARENQDKKGFKSQIVDDVLEILIRNGELPESAQEDPTTPIKTPQAIQYPKASKVNQPPPPPPLPPVTFAITLPTSISFSKNQQNPAVTNIPMLNLNNFLAAANNNASKPFMSQSNQQQHQHKAELTKEEQDILKISEVLSKFGRDHTNQEERNKSLLSNHNHQNQNNDDNDNNTLAMLLGEVEKDLNLDTMDVVLEEEQHAQQLQQQQQQHQNNLNNFQQINPENFMLATHMNQQQSMSVDRSNDELFDALGTLLPTDLDSMPMEMDYSDWLDNLLPEQSNNNLNQLNTNSPLINNSFNNHVNSNNNGVMLSSASDSNQIPTTILSNNNENYSLHQRDPLLSSRSLDIFSAPSLSMNNNNTSSTDNINSSFNLGINNDKVGESGVPSPMAINENLLWDFAM